MRPEAIDAVVDAKLLGYKPFILEVERMTFVCRPLTLNELMIYESLFNNDKIGLEQLEESIVRRSLLFPECDPSDQADHIFRELSPAAPSILAEAIQKQSVFLPEHEKDNPLERALLNNKESIKNNFYLTIIVNLLQTVPGSSYTELINLPVHEIIQRLAVSNTISKSSSKISAPPIPQMPKSGPRLSTADTQEISANASHNALANEIQSKTGKAPKVFEQKQRM